MCVWIYMINYQKIPVSHLRSTDEQVFQLTIEFVKLRVLIHDRLTSFIIDNIFVILVCIFVY